MSRLIFVPQYPTKMRYQEFFISEFPKQLLNYYDEIKILGKEFINSKKFSENKEMFSPIKDAILMEEQQINEYLDLDLKGSDTLLLMDISFPGLFSNILYHKPIKNSYAYCHATSLNTLDYFQKFVNSKFLCESGHAKLFKTIFVGSEYHKQKLKWDNVKVLGLPIPPFKTYKEEKIYNIISVCRPTPQKISEYVENFVIEKFGEITRKEIKTWEEYYKFLSQGKILLISSKEDTFNYSILEAIMNNTIVLAPNRCSYPELLSNNYIYNDINELEIMINNILSHDYYIDNNIFINWNIVNNFYSNLYKEMEVES